MARTGLSEIFAVANSGALTDAEFAAWILIRSFEDPTQGCTAGQATLAERRGVSTRQWRRLKDKLEGKGYLRHERDKSRFIYYPTIPLAKARRSALEHLLETFFKGAEAHAVISILKKSDAKISQDEIESILELIEKTRKEGR